ncbi:MULTISPECIES: DUF302 domain-containing protein [Kitasatospora]|uniref:DUF302 domain-containing protein n=1 Tax=Kitasatospora setae (strain ATCC 33774 / DSM 43861 / JCM 3304 / KCC A-0304 / NBRC 14216 / KM-6054) TaxID=452652 RepID=E4N726_KITSK|nr:MULTISPECIES: DUF302 domain-containing protein [Kitasatospora]BAJ27007.1 hypothetical protein KSE_11730 [Kitasatospora setae KM-6054]
MANGITATLTGIPFAAAAEKVRAALAGQGFGVLTEIDMTATLRAKLGVELEDYLVLGACNPPIAHRALEADRRIGLLLPCNVVLRAVPEGILVEAMDPELMVEFTGRPELAEVADEAAGRLRAALGSLAD